MFKCRICNAPGAAHINHGIAIDRWPGKANGWYCENHKYLPVMEKKHLLKQRQSQQAGGTQ